MNNWLLLEKMIVACFVILGWIYNSKGRKVNDFGRYGHGLVFMFLMELVLWRPIVCTMFSSMIIQSSQTCKKTWHKEHKCVQKEMAKLLSNSYAKCKCQIKQIKENQKCYIQSNSWYW